MFRTRSRTRAKETGSVFVSGQTVPAEVQRVGNRATSSVSPTTLTLPAAPTVGNTLVVMLSGQLNAPPSTISGWTQKQYDNNNVTAFQTVAIFTRIVQAGDTASVLSFTPGATSQPLNTLLVELPGALTITPFIGVPTLAGSVLSVAVTLAASSIQYLSFESDGGGIYSSVSGPATLSFDASNDATNHKGAFFKVTGSGTVATTWASAPSGPIYHGFSAS